jgi:geranylgeranyl reductase
MRTYDAVVVGGGPAGATAAHELAMAGREVLLLDRAGRIKPCGGAIPPKAITDFAIAHDQLVARISGARIVSPAALVSDMPIDPGGFVGMVDRGPFDEWLRERAAAAGAERRTGVFDRIEREADGSATVCFRPPGAGRETAPQRVRARTVIGADGANTAVGRAEVPGTDETPFVFAYHEIVAAPAAATLAGYDRDRCDVVYDGTLSPDFYAWIFPHGDTASIGTGSMHKGFGLKEAVADLRRRTGLDQVETIRREGAPIPLHPRRRWDNARDVVLAGDAAGVVAPASGEGIFYAMLGGRLAAQAIDEFCHAGDARVLAQPRKRFMRVHGPVFWMLGMMQRYWYANDARRERFVAICRDIDVQQLTWDAYMNKELVKARPLAHVRIFFKNLAHLSGLAPLPRPAAPKLIEAGA